MKLTALRLHNVRRFDGRGIAVEGLGDGVNVLCAVNEYGKSTCFDALHALFFQPYSGTPGAVQSLRPYSGGSPLIEADIETADGRFRLAKQFYGAKRADVTDLVSGRRIAQADEAEAFIGELMRGGTAGPTGLLWVRQGDAGIEKKPDKEEKREKHARESVLTSVQGEVEAMTGGRRMAQVIAACEDELTKLVMRNGRPKSGNPYAVAVATRDTLANTEQRLESEVKRLRNALDSRRRLQERLTELEKPDEVAERQDAVATAERAFAVAQAHGDKLKAAEAQVTLTCNVHASAKATLEAHRESLARANTLRGRHAELLHRRDEAVALQRRAADDDDAAANALEAAERDEKEARELLTRFDRALRARDAAERLTSLREALQKAETARREIEDGEAALRGLEVQPKILSELEALEPKIAGLRAAEVAISPAIRMDYVESAAAVVSIGGAALMDGQERRFTGTVRLDIAGVGALTLRSQRVATGKEGLAAAEDRRLTLLSQLGVDTLLQARERHSGAQKQASAIDMARQRLALLAPNGIAFLREEIARLDGESAGELELKGDPAQARQRLQAAEQRLTQARNAAREMRAPRDQANQAVVAAETALAGVAGELTALDSALGSEAARCELEASFLHRFHATLSALNEAERAAESLRSPAPDIGNAEARLRRSKSVLQTATKEAAALREQLADLNGEIRTRSDEAIEEAWQEAAEARAAMDARVNRFASEVAVLTRLRDTLNAARTATREHYFEPVMRELRPLMGLLFEDASVVFDDETLLPRLVRRNGLEEPVAVLSGGMREQLAVLTRLAFARLLARNGRPAPVILDDALAYSDDDRIERMFDALHRQSRDQQIIVFSCRQRAFARLGGNLLQMTAWEPGQN